MSILEDVKDSSFGKAVVSVTSGHANIVDGITNGTLWDSLHVSDAEQSVLDNQHKDDEAKQAKVLDKRIQFDYRGAREKGFSSEQIVNYIAKNPKYRDKFDIVGGLNAVDGDYNKLLDYMDRKQGRKGVPDYVGNDGRIMEASKEAWDDDAMQADRMVEQIAKDRGEPLSALEKDKVFEIVRKKRGTSYNPNDFKNEFKATMVGLKQLTGDFFHSIGLDPTSTYYKEFSAENRKVLEDLNNAVKDPTFFSSGTFGRQLPALATLPISVEVRGGLALMGLAEATAGASVSRGEGNTLDNSLKDGAIQGATAVGSTLVIAGILKVMSPRAVDKVHEYVMNDLSLSTDEADNMFTNYAKATGAEDTLENRTLAMVEGAGKDGKSLLQRLSKDSTEIADAVNNTRADHIRAMKAEVPKAPTGEGASEVDVPATLDIRSKQISKEYGRVKSIITNKPSKSEFNLPIESLEIATDRTAIKEVLEMEGRTTGDIIEIMPNLNVILARTKGSINHKWSELKNSLEKELQNSLSHEHYEAWRKVNDDYRLMSNVQESSIGKAIMDKIAGKIETPEMLRMISTDKKAGNQTFKYIKEMMGTKASDKIENTIINELLTKHKDDFSIKSISKAMKVKGFQSAKGKQLQSYMQNMEDTFKTDDVISTMLREAEIDMSGKSTNLALKFVTASVGRVYKYTVGRFDQELLNRDALGDLLKNNPNAIKKLEDVFSDMSEGVKRSLVKQTIEELQTSNLLPRKVHGADGNDIKPFTSNQEPLINDGQGVSVKPRVVSATESKPKPKGSAKDVAKAYSSWQKRAKVKVLSEGEQNIHVNSKFMHEWLRDTKLSNTMQGNQVISRVYDLMGSNSWANHLEGVRRKAIMGTAYSDAKMAKSMADKTFNNINASVGTRLGRKDWEKLVEHYMSNIRKEAPMSVEGARVDPSFTNYLTSKESGNLGYTAQNPTSSAYGKYQVIKSTNEEVAKRLGISIPFSKTPEGQELVFSYLSKGYEVVLNKLGVETSKENKYIVHQLGAGRASRYFTKKLNSKDVSVMKDNIPKKYHKKGMTKDEIISKWNDLYSK